MDEILDRSDAQAIKRLTEIHPKIKEMKIRYEDEFKTRRNGMNNKNASVEMARKLLKMAKTLVAGGKGKAYCQHNGETYELQCAVTIEESSDCTMSGSTFFVTNEVMEAYKAFTFPPNVYRAGLVVKGHKAFAYFSLFSADDKEWLIEQANELGYELVDDYGRLFD